MLLWLFARQKGGVVWFILNAFTILSYWLMVFYVVFELHFTGGVMSYFLICCDNCRRGSILSAHAISALTCFVVQVVLKINP